MDDRVPDTAPPWIAQFVGVELTPGLDSDSQRLRIRETAGSSGARSLPFEERPASTP